MLLMYLNLMLNMLFLILKHPLSMGITIIMQTLLISMITGMSYKSFWFSYILFLMFIGGMMVLFIYMTSLTPNLMFSSSYKNMIMLMMTAIIVIMISKLNINIINNDMFNNLEYSNNILMKMYDSPMNISVMMIASYLLLTMITVFKITESNTGPLRMMYN